MKKLSASRRATIVAAIGIVVCGASTLAKAAATMAEDFTFTRRIDVASQHVQKGPVQNPGTRVSLNPQPLPPRQKSLSTSVTVISNIGSALAVVGRKQ